MVLRLSRGFVVLPDSDAALRVAATLSGQAADVVPHASGRPMVIMRGSQPMLRAAAGRSSLVVIGFCPVTTGRLAALAGQVRTLADVDRVARELPGSFHLIAVADGRVRVQGSRTGLRPLYHARIDGVAVAADRADTLAALSGRGVDEQALAVRVVCGTAPPPLGEQSLWHGVALVPPDHYLVLERDRARPVLWWRAPEPVLPLAAGARGVRDALVDATAHRRGRISVDLSGGMDSSTLCFLIARHTPTLLTFRTAEAEAGNDDAHYAAEAARCLPQAEHLVLQGHELPEVFAEPDRPTDTDQPGISPATDARTRHIAATLAARGYRWHLAGHGGDELFMADHGYLPGLLRRHPLTALRYLRTSRILGRWPLAATLKGVAFPGTVRAWWLAQADQLTGPPPNPRDPNLSWGSHPLRAPACATAEAVAATRAALRQTAELAEPLAADLGQHQNLLELRTSAADYRQLAGLYAEHGVYLDLPYLDDRVVDAALRVQVHQRSTPWRYKAVLSEAMRGILPEPIRTRASKGEFSAEAGAGLRRHLPAILALFADSALARLGLLDTTVLRRQLHAPQADLETEAMLENLIGCETWLRAAQQPSTVSWRTDVTAAAP